MGPRSFGKEVETLRHLTRNQPAIIDDMGQALSKQRDRKRNSEARQDRDIAIYQSHMRGNSQRAIQEEFSIKSCQTVHAAIIRGRELVKERGIDLEERRIEIDEMFKNTLAISPVKLHGKPMKVASLRLSATTVQRRSGAPVASTPALPKHWPAVLTVGRNSWA